MHIFVVFLQKWDIDTLCNLIEWKKSENGLRMERALRDVCVVSLFWLMLSLLRREFILLGMIPVAVVLVTVLGRGHFSGRLMKIWPVLLAGVFFMIIFMTDSLFRSGERLNAGDVFKRSLYFFFSGTGMR